MYDVAAVGILVVDVIVKPVDALPGSGMLDLVSSVEMFSGGNAMTAAINLAKLGLKPALIGKVGTDAFGDFLIKCLDENNVVSDGVKRESGVQTSASVALSATDGERSFLHCKGANSVFDISDIDYNIIKQSNIIFVTGTFLQDNFDGKQTVDFLKECKRLGKTTALDVCWDKNADSKWLVNDAMPYIDIFMPSIDEAKMMSGFDSVDKISEYFIKNGAGCVVIKCGGDGCFVRNSLEIDGTMIPSVKNITVVDTTGAGDSFCSGFLAAYTKGYDIYECAKFGNAVGACCVTKKGATSGTLTFEETLKLIK